MGRSVELGEDLEKAMGPYLTVEDGASYPTSVTSPVAHATDGLYRDVEIRFDGERPAPALAYPLIEVAREPEGTRLVMAGAATPQTLEAAKARARELGILPQAESTSPPVLAPKTLKPRSA